MLAGGDRGSVGAGFTESGYTQHTLDRFEATGMATEMPEDYDKLLAILDDAVNQQRAQTLAMLA